METCEDGHEPIVYIPKRRERCPLCTALSEISDLSEQVDDLLAGKE